MTCEKGKCFECGKQIIKDKKTTPEYTQVLFTLSDGSRMPLSVCLDHMESVFNLDKKEMMDAIVDAWESEINKADWTPERKEKYLERYSSLRIVK